MRTPSILEVEDLTVRFGGLVAVDCASLTLSTGDIHGLIGPNGAGKSTLFNAVSGLVTVAGGTIRLAGEDITGMPAHARAGAGIRRTFQSVHLIPNRTVLENVLTGLHTQTETRALDLLSVWRRNQPEVEAREAVEETLEFLGIAETLLAEVRTLSFARQRFVEIARAIVAKPPLLLLDEPAAGLSPVDIGHFTETIRRLRQERQVSILLVEHVISLVTELCDRVSVLDDGVLIAEGDPRHIMEHPSVRAAYFGEGEDA